MAKTLEIVLKSRTTPALFIGNGINRHKNSSSSSWEDLLGKLARDRGLNLPRKQMEEMSNTEFFDILDLARPSEDKSSLQQEFCGLMHEWRPAAHHALIMDWARRHATPVITVNFDENLSNAARAEFFRGGDRFTDYYPWSSYFSDAEIGDPRASFAIWHAHGMRQYRRSIRLGLTHYMGAVQRARPLIYNRGGLRELGSVTPLGVSGTWLEVFFFCPLVMLGFGFNKDETFLRWLFLERARLHRLRPEWKRKTWFVVKEDSANEHRRPFFERLGMEFVTVPDFAEIYENEGWSG